MQLGALPDAGPAPDDVAAALRAAAARLGHRPAITQLLPSGRQEQSVASLAQWAAKGAHFLEIELGLAAGDRLHLDAPPGWTTAAVALAAWWAGIAVTTTPDGEFAVVHSSRAPRAGTAAAEALAATTEILWLGDGIDGAPVGDRPGPGQSDTPAGADDHGTALATRGEPWVRAVQSFPDQPPPSRAAGAAIAVVDGQRTTTQRELLALAVTEGDDGTLGLDRPSLRGAGRDRAHPWDASTDLAWLCLRPLQTGRPTVVTREVPRGAAAGDRVGQWR